jgi:hypothetical protein
MWRGLTYSMERFTMIISPSCSGPGRVFPASSYWPAYLFAWQSYARLNAVDAGDES